MLRSRPARSRTARSSRRRDALERMSYRRSDAVTVLSDDLADNVRGKLPPAAGERVHVIPNFVDTDAIVPGDRLTPYRAELGLGDGPVVLYAGNVGFSQSLDLMLAAAARDRPMSTFLVNGDGAARPALERAARGSAPTSASPATSSRTACRSCWPPATSTSSRSRRGLARVSVPSKTYSIMAAARPVLASIDPGTAVPKILDQSGGGVAVPPDEPVAFVRGPARAARRPGRRRGHRATRSRLGGARGVTGGRRGRIPPAHRLAGPLNPLQSPAPDSLACSWHPPRHPPRKPPSSPSRARARRSASRAEQRSP